MDAGTFGCDSCEKKYTRRDHLIRHQRSAHSIKTRPVVWACPTCPKWFDEKHKLNRHERKVHLKPFPCKICGLGFGKANKLRSHLCSTHTDRTVQELRPLFLETLRVTAKDDALAQEFESETHEQKNGPVPSIIGATESGRYPCLFPKCLGLSFTNFNQLKRHWQRHLKRYVCHLCPKQTASKFLRFNELRKHIKSDHQIYGCEECEESFKTKRDFQRHRRLTGHGLRSNILLDDFQCPDCPKIFRTSGGLHDHRRRKHSLTGEAQKFRCDDCGYETDLKQSLLRHNHRHKNRAQNRFQSIQIRTEPTREIKQEQRVANDSASVATATPIAMGDYTVDTSINDFGPTSLPVEIAPELPSIDSQQSYEDSNPQNVKQFSFLVPSALDIAEIMKVNPGG